jgi:hypothetical protein
MRLPCLAIQILLIVGFTPEKSLRCRTSFAGVGWKLARGMGLSWLRTGKNLNSPGGTTADGESRTRNLRFTKKSLLKMTNLFSENPLYGLPHVWWARLND